MNNIIKRLLCREFSLKQLMLLSKIVRLPVEVIRSTKDMTITCYRHSWNVMRLRGHIGCDDPIDVFTDDILVMLSSMKFTDGVNGHIMIVETNDDDKSFTFREEGDMRVFKDLHKVTDHYYRGMFSYEDFHSGVIHVVKTEGNIINVVYWNSIRSYSIRDIRGNKACLSNINNALGTDCYGDKMNQLPDDMMEVMKMILKL